MTARKKYLADRPLGRPKKWVLPLRGITVQLPPQLIVALDAQADEMNTSRSDVVREACARALADRGLDIGEW